MAERGFVPVARTSDVPDPGSVLVAVGERLVMLAQVDGRFYALDDVCTHDGGPLSEGAIHHGAIVCPRHGARSDLATGKALSMPATEPTAAHEIRLDGDTILVRLRDG